MKIPYKKTLSFDKINIEKRKFHFSKEPVIINDVKMKCILLLEKHSIM